MKVSIICFVYNHAKYLKSALEGFVNQKTSFNYEVIIHDDASTDESAQIIQEYAKQYPDIIKPICQKENQYSKGISIFDTYMLPMCSGEYIAICEGDDYWCCNDKLQKQVDFLDNHKEYSACVHNTIQYDMVSNKKTTMYEVLEDCDLLTEAIISRTSSCFHTSSLVYRKEYALVRPSYFTKAKGFSDYPRAIQLALAGKIRFIATTMSVYRYGTVGSWTNRLKSDTKKTALSYFCFCEILKDVNQYTKGKYNEVVSEAIDYYTYLQKYFEEDYSALRKDPLKKYYLQQSISYRIKTYIKQIFRGPYRLFRKIKYRN